VSSRDFSLSEDHPGADVLPVARALLVVGLSSGSSFACPEPTEPSDHRSDVAHQILFVGFRAMRLVIADRQLFGTDPIAIELYLPLEVSHVASPLLDVGRVENLRCFGRDGQARFAIGLQMQISSCNRSDRTNRTQSATFLTRKRYGPRGYSEGTRSMRSVGGRASICARVSRLPTPHFLPSAAGPIPAGRPPKHK